MQHTLSPTLPRTSPPRGARTERTPLGSRARRLAPPSCLVLLSIYAVAVALWVPVAVRPRFAPLVLLPLAIAAWQRNRVGAVVISVLTAAVHAALWPAETLAPPWLPGVALGHAGLALVGLITAQASLWHRRNATLESVFGLMPAGLILVDTATGLVQDHNAAARELAGLAPSPRGAPLPVQHLLPPDAWAQARSGALQGAESRWTLPGAPGLPPRRVALQAFPIEMDRRPFVLITVRDITRQEALETELLQAERARGEASTEAQVARANHLAQLGTVAAGVGHEINNPLAFMLINLELALDELIPHMAADPTGTRSAARLDELRDMLDDTRTGARQIQGVVRELQQFSRSSVADAAPTDVREFVGRAAHMAAHTFPPDLDFSYAHTGGARAHCAAAKLSQVVINLLTNAAHAVSGTEGARIRLRTDGDDTGLHITVTDNGCGIPADQLERVFDPFFTTKPVGQGTGLGLAVCRTIISELGGRLTVDSTVGRGTSVRIWLPVAAEAPAPAPAPAPATAAPTGLPTVLVVDDDPQVRTALSRLLRDFAVTLAASGAEALALVQSRRFDRILLDLAMPGMSGMETHQALQRTAPDQADRVLFLTGGVVDLALRAFVQVHEDRVLHKPIGRELIDRLQAPLPAAGPPEGGATCRLRATCRLKPWFEASPTNRFYLDLYCTSAAGSRRCHRQRHVTATGTAPPDDLLPDGRQLETGPPPQEEARPQRRLQTDSMTT